MNAITEGRARALGSPSRPIGSPFRPQARPPEQCDGCRAPWTAGPTLPSLSCHGSARPYGDQAAFLRHAHELTPSSHALGSWPARTPRTHPASGTSRDLMAWTYRAPADAGIDQLPWHVGPSRSPTGPSGTDQ